MNWKRNSFCIICFFSSPELSMCYTTSTSNARILVFLIFENKPKTFKHGRFQELNACNNNLFIILSQLFWFISNIIFQWRQRNLKIRCTFLSCIQSDIVSICRLFWISDRLTVSRQKIEPSWKVSVIIVLILTKKSRRKGMSLDRQQVLSFF